MQWSNDLAAAGRPRIVSPDKRPISTSTSCHVRNTIIKEASDFQSRMLCCPPTPFGSCSADHQDGLGDIGQSLAAKTSVQ